LVTIPSLPTPTAESEWVPVEPSEKRVMKAITASGEPKSKDNKHKSEKVFPTVDEVN